MFNQMVEHTSAPLNRTFRALANPVRREMLRRLSSRDMRVTELAAYFNMSLAAAAKHIGQLERAGLISRRRSGRDHWISIEAAPMEDAADWLARYRSLWIRRPEG
jgi:DNA-binding transcriptional ArsR family regulator